MPRLILSYVFVWATLAVLHSRTSNNNNNMHNTSSISTATALTVPSPTATTRILSVGIASVDFVAALDHFPEPDEKLRSTSLVIAGGGNAANTACAIGQLASSKNYDLAVDLATAVGGDANGATIRQGLKDYGVGTQYMEEIPDSSSPFSYVMTTPDGARTIVHQPATRDMSLDFGDSIPLQHTHCYKAVHFDVRHPNAAVRLAERCVKLGIPYSVDVERPRDGLLELLSKATVVICNSDYCNAILGPSSTSSMETNYQAEIADRLATVMRDQAPNAQLVLQTLGSKGSCLIRMHPQEENSDEEDTVIILEEDSTSQAPRVVQKHGALWCETWGGCTVVDSTGAGDAFQGGFLAALWMYVDSISLPTNDDLASITTPILARCLRIATRVAAKKLERPGAREGLPKPSQDPVLERELDVLLGMRN